MKVAVAAVDLERPLLEELGDRVRDRFDRLILYDDDTFDPVWAQNIWLDPHYFKFNSLGEAADQLRSIQRNWSLHSSKAHRRAKLIEERLPPMRLKARHFPSPVPQAPLGSWTLVDENTMLYSAVTKSPFPDGELIFAENKTDPPSRAYLKLWELFTLEGKYPGPGDRVLDLGSSPGGWTWVLDELGCEVLSVDKAPLAPGLRLSKRVRMLNESAFALNPNAEGSFSWLFSDVICYPERLLELVHRWRAADPKLNFVCTLKFQAPTNHEITKEFLKIEGSTLRHLTHNKHELTWALIQPIPVAVLP